jgi:hypothetical protein
MDEYRQLSFFYNFLISIFVFMPCVRYLPIINNPNNKTISRKINQYTNWNLFMLACNSIIYNYYHIDNVFISKFLALNSLQIFFIYHMFILYDSRVLFDILDNAKPFLLNIGKYNTFMIRLEYFIINFFIHILPAYMYKDYILQKLPDEPELNIGIYTILFKFMWALNVFGNFNVVSIYLPTFDFCSVKLFNMIVVFDYLSGAFFEMYKHNKCIA